MLRIAVFTRSASSQLSKTFTHFVTQSNTSDVKDLGKRLQGELKCNGIQAAQTMFEDIPKEKLNTTLFNMMIDAYAKDGRFHDCLKMFKKMINLKIKPDVININTVIDGLLRWNKSGDVISLFNAMKDAGFKPHASTIGLLISKYTKLRNFQMAKRIYFDVMPKYDISPDVSVVGAVLEMYIKSNEISAAKSLFDSTPDSNKGYAVYTIMIKLYFDEGNIDMVEHLYQQMKDNSVPATLLTFTTMMSGYNKYKKYDKTMQLFDEMTKIGIKPDTKLYNAILAAYCRMGNMANAHSILAMMEEKDLATYHRMIEGCIASKDASQLLWVMEKLFSSNLEPDIITFNLLIKAALRFQLFEETERLLYIMKEDYRIQPNQESFKLLKEAYKFAGQKDLFEQFKKKWQSKYPPLKVH